jgi:hypothetical protein
LNDVAVLAVADMLVLKADQVILGPGAQPFGVNGIGALLFDVDRDGREIAAEDVLLAKNLAKLTRELAQLALSPGSLIFGR